jgi:hypothetical protein
LTVFSLLTLYLSSRYFPWNDLALHGKVGALLAQVQFPWRYLGLATIFLSLLVGALIEQLQLHGIAIQKIGCQIVLLGVIVLCSFFGQYMEQVGITGYQTTADLDLYGVSGGEYLRDGTDIESLDGTIIYTNMEKVELIERAGCSMTL